MMVKTNSSFSADKSIEEPKSKKVKRELPYEIKKKICDFYNENKKKNSKFTQQQVVDHFTDELGYRLPNSTISDIIRLKDRYIYLNDSKTYRNNSAKYPELENYLFVWIRQLLNNDQVKITDQMIIEQAIKFSQMLNITNFNYSNGWLEKFKKRHNIMQHNNTTVVKSAHNSHMNELINKDEQEEQNSFSSINIPKSSVNNNNNKSINFNNHNNKEELIEEDLTDQEFKELIMLVNQDMANMSSEEQEQDNEKASSNQSDVQILITHSEAKNSLDNLIRYFEMNGSLAKDCKLDESFSIIKSKLDKLESNKLQF